MTTERSSFDDSNVDAVLATREDTMLHTGLDDSEPLGGTGSVWSGSTSADGSGGGDRLGEAAGGVAEHLADTAQRQVGTQVNSGLIRAGDMLEQLAGAVRTGGEEMRQQQPQLAGFADTAAGQVDKAAQFVRGTDFQGLIREAEGFARRQPAVFLGGALAVGLLASRFLKASPQGGSASSSGRVGLARSSYRSGYGAGYGGASRGAYDSGYQGGTLAGGTGSMVSTSSDTGAEHGGV